MLAQYGIRLIRSYAFGLYTRKDGRQFNVEGMLVVRNMYAMPSIETGDIGSNDFIVYDKNGNQYYDETRG